MGFIPPQPAVSTPAVNQQFTRIPIPDSGIPLESFERDIILSAVEKAEGNLSKAARLLKISRGKLRYRIERLNITQRDVVTLKLATMQD